MTVREIYTAYKIMPTLQMHQLRAGAVAKLTCNSFDGEVEAHDVITACLLHDMGNIIKSDFSAFPEFVEPEGEAYWTAVKEDFIRRYGSDSHKANVAIMRELGVPEHVAQILDDSGFSRLQEILHDGSTELKLLQYADMRVGPHGILSMEERLEEGRERYRGKNKSYYDSDEEYEKLHIAAQNLERDIFKSTTIRPEDINDITAAPVIEKLWEYEVA
jgi:hypothetical protein